MGQGGPEPDCSAQGRHWGQTLQRALFLHAWSLEGFLYPTPKDSKHYQANQHFLGVPEGAEYSGVTQGLG